MHKTFFITGASRGLGRALAEGALLAGHRAVLSARNTASLDDLVRQYPETAAVIELDVTDPDAVRRSVDETQTLVGLPDVVVTNAGYSDLVSIEDAELVDLRSQMETNFWGVVHVTKAFLPALRSRGSGRFVHISSVSGRLAAAPGLGGYVAAKFAAEGFLEALALETAGFGLEVVIVQPGAMATTLATAMTLPAPGAAYAELMAPMISRYRAESQAPGGTTPEDAADFVLRVAAMPDPPLRLPLGAEAHRYISAGTSHQLAELNRWQEFSTSVSSRSSLTMVARQNH